MGGTQAVRFGSSQALGKHDVTHKRGKYTTPAPGDYTVEGRHNLKFKASQTSAFGGNLCAVNREKTGLAAEGYRKMADPGPAHYSTTAANQAIKVKERAPTFNFGSSTRDDGAKAYMFRGDTSGTADPNAGNAGRGVPGPGTYAQDRHQTKTKLPEYSFGVKHKDLTKATTGVIGPGAYDHKTQLGTQTSSMKPSSPAFGMGSASREKTGMVLSPGFSPVSLSKTPAPGAYQQGSGVGRQPLSKYSSANAWKFGSDDRLKAEKLVTAVPGPGRYSNNSMLGIQSSSRYQTSGGFKFGTSDRQSLSEGLVG